MQPMCIDFFLRLYHIYVACCTKNSCMYTIYSRLACVCTWLLPLSPVYSSVDDTLELPLRLSFCTGCSVFFTHFWRCPCVSELELWASIFFKYVSLPYFIPSSSHAIWSPHHGLSSFVPSILGFVFKSTTVVASHDMTVKSNVSYLITSPTPHGVIKSSIISPFIRSTFKRFVTISIT